MYDRLVHLACGVLLYPVLLRLFHVWLPEAKPFKLFLLVVQFIMATSLIYEWLEWLIAIGLSPEDAEKLQRPAGRCLGCTYGYAACNTWGCKLRSASICAGVGIKA